MKICFMGTPAIAAAVLHNIAKVYTIDSLYTKPPSRQSRGLKLTFSKAHEVAIANNIKVFHPKSFKKPEVVEQFIQQQFDLAIVVAYGLILPQTIFSSPKFGTINLHGSLLPKWRGAAPVERSIEAGDTATGPTIMYIEKGLDTGDIIFQEAFPIDDTTTATEVYHKMAETGSKLILKVLDYLHKGIPLPAVKQCDDLASYAKILSKEEGKIDFNNTSHNIIRKIHAFEIYPGIYFKYNDESFKIKKASIVNISSLTAWLHNNNVQLPTISQIKPGFLIPVGNNLYITTSDGLVKIEIIQRAGKKPLKIEDFTRGYTFNPGYIQHEQ